MLPPFTYSTSTAPVQVAYRRGGASVLGLEIPLEAATNSSELASYQERELKRQKLKESGEAGVAADAIPKVKRAGAGLF